MCLVENTRNQPLLIGSVAEVQNGLKITLIVHLASAPVQTIALFGSHVEPCTGLVFKTSGTVFPYTDLLPGK